MMFFRNTFLVIIHFQEMSYLTPDEKELMYWQTEMYRCRQAIERTTLEQPVAYCKLSYPEVKRAMRPFERKGYFFNLSRTYGRSYVITRARESEMLKCKNKVNDLLQYKTTPSSVYCDVMPEQLAEVIEATNQKDKLNMYLGKFIELKEDVNAVTEEQKCRMRVKRHLSGFTKECSCKGTEEEIKQYLEPFTSQGHRFQGIGFLNIWTLTKEK